MSFRGWRLNKNTNVMLYSDYEAVHCQSRSHQLHVVMLGNMKLHLVKHYVFHLHAPALYTHTAPHTPAFLHIHCGFTSKLFLFFQQKQDRNLKSFFSSSYRHIHAIPEVKPWQYDWVNTSICFWNLHTKCMNKWTHHTHTRTHRRICCYKIICFATVGFSL